MRKLLSIILWSCEAWCISALHLLGSSTLGKDPQTVNRLNGESFQQDPLVTFNGFQYAVFWVPDSSNASMRYASISRRCIDRTAACNSDWETFILTDYAETQDDGHNVISLGISPGDGTLHIGFDQHDNPLNYRISQPDVATRPLSIAWSPQIFGPTLDYLPGLEDLDKSVYFINVTYPRFLRIPSEGEGSDSEADLLFELRVGRSGLGDDWLYKYVPGKGWIQIGRYLEGVNNNAYINGLDFDSQNVLHATWTYRDYVNDTGQDVAVEAGPNGPENNHDMDYAFSRDLGMTWQNTWGQSIANTTAQIPIVPVSAGITVFSIPKYGGILNQESQVIDAEGRVHVLNRENTTGIEQWYHYWRSTAGLWTRNPLPPPDALLGSYNITGSPTVIGKRGKFVAPSDTQSDTVAALLAILPSNAPNSTAFTIIKSTAVGHFRDWEVLWAAADGCSAEPLFDRYRLQEDDVLSVFLVNGREVQVLDFELNAESDYRRKREVYAHADGTVYVIDVSSLAGVASVTNQRQARSQGLKLLDRFAVPVKFQLALISRCVQLPGCVRLRLRSRPAPTRRRTAMRTSSRCTVAQDVDADDVRVLLDVHRYRRINIAEWSGAAASLALGLNVGQAIAGEHNIYGMDAVIDVGAALSFMTTGHAGGKWHVPFAVINRASWGIRGAWFTLMNRIILSCVWQGVQSWYGGQMVKVMIGAIWPSFYNLKNHFPPNIGMETNDFVGFIIFVALCFPLFLLRPEHYRIPAIISSALVTVTAFCVFIWALAKQGNGGPLFNNPEAVYGVGHLEGSTLGWVMMRCITSGIGAWSGGILYQSDFSRYAVNPGAQLYGQIFVIPLCLLGSNILGIVTTSCARGFYPDEPLLWKLYDLFAAIQRHGGARARAAVFFASFTFFLAQLCVTIVACGVVGGMDLAALLPRWFNIRRGSMLIGVVGICINPWRILNTANSFISAMSAYGVFLGPLTGIMMADYHVLRARKLKISHLFVPSPASDYWFWHGLNWRAPIAWLLGVWPNMPGFSASVTPNSVEVKAGWTHVYYLSWLLGFCISASVWIALNALWPAPGLREADAEIATDTDSTKSSPGFDYETKSIKGDVECAKVYSIAAQLVPGADDVTAFVGNVFATYDFSQYMQDRVEGATKKVQTFVTDFATITLPKHTCAALDTLETTVQDYAADLLANSNMKGPTISTVRSFISTTSQTVSVALRFQTLVQGLWKDETMLDRFLWALGDVYSSAFADAVQNSPPSLQPASSHDERSKLMAVVSANAEYGFMQLCTSFGIPEDEARELHARFNELAPYIEMMMTTAGDIIEEHPLLFKVVRMVLVRVIPPPLWFLLQISTNLLTMEEDEFTAKGLLLRWRAQRKSNLNDGVMAFIPGLLDSPLRTIDTWEESGGSIASPAAAMRRLLGCEYYERVPDKDQSYVLMNE
ncbi:hypothetical protein NM688_g2946 [Phlebia brevispora]|uniref:Uncharacterized protein n=1 Tax=Phlebia brevispora TaxID=194682 RepID=A0ACC1T754_9APHY|nr:hypothetical protein NM688_g2946 [Phlebia brevispora]